MANKCQTTLNASPLVYIVRKENWLVEEGRHSLGAKYTDRHLTIAVWKAREDGNISPAATTVEWITKQ